MNEQALRQALINLPVNAQESIVDNIFVPEFLQALGFELIERVPQYNTGNGKPVDYALRHNLDEDIFLATQSNLRGRQAPRNIYRVKI